jgi:hypothetical protein
MAVATVAPGADASVAAHLAAGALATGAAGVGGAAALGGEEPAWEPHVDMEPGSARQTRARTGESLKSLESRARSST